MKKYLDITKPRYREQILPAPWHFVMSRFHFTCFTCSRIECFHSRGQHLCKFIETKESVCIRKEFNSQKIGLGHQHGRCFIVLGHQYGRRDVMWKHSISRHWEHLLSKSFTGAFSYNRPLRWLWCLNEISKSVIEILWDEILWIELR